MSNDHYEQGQVGRNQLLHHMVLSGVTEAGDQFSMPSSSSGGGMVSSRVPAQQEQQLLSQIDTAVSYPSGVSQNPDGRGLSQMHIEQLNHSLRINEEKMAYSHLAASNILQGHGASPNPSPGLDGQSLYCTVLPSSSPPSQPFTVEGGGTSRRGLLAVNGGAGSQPVQYTIIITDPQLQQNSGGGSNNNTSGATSILLNTLVQQHQHQLQLHLASRSKANSNLASLVSAAVPQTSASLPVNTTSVNGSSKLSTLLISNNSINNVTTFPANLIATSLNNTPRDGKNIHVTNVALPANSKLIPTVIDSEGVEGGYFILNYADPSLPAGTATITNINQLVNLHGGAATRTADVVVTQGSTHLIKSVTDANSSILSDKPHNAASNNCIVVSRHSDLSQEDIEIDARNFVPYNGQALSKEISGSVDSSCSKDNSAHLSPHLSLSLGEQLLDSASSGVRVSGGMHSGRTGAGSGQAHGNHPQQQQQQQQHHHHSPISSSSASSVVSAAIPSQAAMLSAGQPAVPSGIFRTGSENSSPSHRMPGAGSSSYVPAQYHSICGVHRQSPSHLTTIPPYTFFQGFGGSGASGHGFPHGALMSSTSPGHYPHIESYSAMLASMGSHVHNRGAQGTDRPPRVQAPGVAVPQRTGIFLPSAAHLAAPGAQYPNMPSSSSHRRLSGSSSPSPGPAAAPHNPQAVSSRLDPASSHHLEKLAAIKGGTGLQSREGEVSRDLRHYGESSGLHDEKSSLSSAISYAASGHITKVSFDSVVKEYGGCRDSPTGRGDVYFRASLSGKEGSLKHRILTRPSDSDLADDLSKVSGVHGLKDEPVSKRSKFSNISSASPSYITRPGSPIHMAASPRSSSRHHSVAHVTSHQALPNNSNSNTSDARTGGVSHDTDNSLPGRQGQLPSPYPPNPAEENSAGSRYRQTSYHSSSPSPPPQTSSSPPGTDNPSSHLQYPSHFVKGSIIQLANGTLKRVEDLQTEDFVNSADISSDLKVDSSTVVRIEEQLERGTAMLSFSVGEHRVQVTVEATLEHPFFVFGQGWSSCSVSRTLARYGLDCQKLNVGDVCISLTHKDVNLKAAEISQQQQQQHEQSYLVASHNKLAMSSGSATTDKQIPSPQSSTANPSLSSPSAPPSNSSSFLKQEAAAGNMNFLPPPPTTTTAASCSVSVPMHQRRLSQTELPPPSSNIVPVKKESNNNINTTTSSSNHPPFRRGPQRGEGERKGEAEEDDGSDATSSLRKRRWSAPDPVTLKADQEREKERQLLANEAQKAEEASLEVKGDAKASSTCEMGCDNTEEN